ncbi:MAG: hypothetical protein ACFB50_10660 [Rubrobacteraceae bacterium]
MSEPLEIIFSEDGNIFYQELASRIATACEEISYPAKLRSAQEIERLAKEDLQERVAVLVMPSECLISVGNSREFLSAVASAKKRILLLAEAMEDKWWEAQFQLPVEYDAFVDVGFVSQEEKTASLSAPYHFLFDGPTEPQRRVLERGVSSEKRSIPWTLVGNMGEGRAELLMDLIEEVNPGGFVFLPKAHARRRQAILEKTHWMLSPSELSRVLKHTRYYVWCSRHSFKYYESFRFIEALLAGAVPCKIVGEDFWKETDVPCIFSSVEDFGKRIRSVGFDRMFQSSRDYYLSWGLLSEHLRKVLDDVL